MKVSLFPQAWAAIDRLWAWLTAPDRRYTGTKLIDPTRLPSDHYSLRQVL